MINVLLEIGCEEIPARFMPDFLEDLKKKAEEKFTRERISFSGIRTMGTYRRLVLFVENVSPKQMDLASEVKGPPAEIAFDCAGKHTKAAEGFAKSQKVSLSKLEVRTLGAKNYVFAKVVRKGKPTEEVLPTLLPEIISSLYQPLAMRWGEIDFKFIRPIHWILALCGSKVVRFEVGGIGSGNRTCAHRYYKKNVGTTLAVPALRAEPQGEAGRQVVVRLSGQGLDFARGNQALSLHSYKEFLLKLGVIVDQEERKALIRKRVEEAAKKEKAKALIEEDLLSEVVYLVEDPIAYVGKFDKDFLSLPQAVLITSMKKNQKYFSLLNQAGKLMEKFIVIADGGKNAEVVKGNQKVLSARLADAKFFFEEDRKEPLKLRIPDLERIAFFENLGTLSEKTKRMARLCEWMGKHLKVDAPEIKTAVRIAELCKADLTTRMVHEFPVLQGVMGCEYALLSGENPKVAQGIYEHYLPRYAEDKLPQSREGILAALADRVDSIVGCFSVGAVPSGSEDPYGLRRAAHGIIRIILEHKLDLLLDELLSFSYKLYEPIFAGNQKVEEFGKMRKQILEFLAGRLKPLLLDRGIRYDVVDAVLSDLNDILDAVAKASALNRIAAFDWFNGVVASADRVSRIAKDSSHEEVVSADLIEKEEKELFELYLKVNWEVGEAVNAEKWEEAAHFLAKLTDPIEFFFEKVLVMHEDEKLRTNRLALLKLLEKLYLRVADFRKIVL